MSDSYLDTSEFCDRFGHSFLDDDGPVKVCRECFTSYRDDTPFWEM
jgi:hypothetical protein